MTTGIKTVLLGEATSGKTSIATRLVSDKFYSDNEATIGAGFLVGNGKKFNDMKFAFWDTAGQERFASIIPMYYRDAKIVMLVFDMSNLSTIDRLITYLEKIQSEIRGDFETIIIGNKLDLIDDVNGVNKYVRDKLENFSEIVGNTDYVYVSSKTNKNFDILLKKILEKGKSILNGDDDLSDNNIVNIDSTLKSSYANCAYCV